MEINKEGLTSSEVLENRKKYGENKLESKKRLPWIVRYLLEFKDPLIIVLIIAAIVSVVVDRSSWGESVIILCIVLINAFLGVNNEDRAEKSLEALKKLSSPVVKVLRSDGLTKVVSTELVVGDIVLVEAGDYVPADGVLLEAINLKVDEAPLTGESVPVEKDINSENKLFSSTFVTTGRGKFRVTAVGMNSEVGKIAKMLAKQKQKKTPLQAKLDQIGLFIGIGAIAICVVIFLLEWLVVEKGNKNALIDAFKTAVALAVAAIPEGLSTIVTVVLAIGVLRMVKENAIIKKLPAVETLGSTNVVCSDKTGTLTQNKMTVVKVYDGEVKELKNGNKQIYQYLAYASDAVINIIDEKEVRVGDPTETALIAVNNEFGLNCSAKRISELQFDSDRKLMSVLVEENGKKIMITKGAPDVLFKRCLPSKVLEKAEAANSSLADDALRVLAVAYKELDKEELTYEDEKELIFLGMVGMIDPPRLEVKDSIALAKKAGIKTVMITGDHLKTAIAIAKDLGIYSDGDIALSGEDLKKMTEEELDQKIDHISVYARVMPEDKVRIVEAWQKKQKVVAMTGDGVNDSPALKAADIGCAMGITGTDVSKEASDMILLDDNFSTIIKAVKEGRGIYQNIKKTVHYLLSSNIGEVLAIFLASIIASLLTKVSLGVPLLPSHLLWINLITDSLPAFALGKIKVEDDIMNEKPLKKNASFFANRLGFKIIYQGIYIGIISLVSYLIGWLMSGKNPDSYLGHTMAFFTLATLQLFHCFNLKSNKTIFSKKTFDNYFFILSFVLGFGLQLLIIYIPPFAKFFKLKPLNAKEFFISFGLAFSIIFVVEIEKLIAFIFRRKQKHGIISV